MNAEKDTCNDKVLHAVSAAAYDQVSYAQAHFLATHNITKEHVDYLQKKMTVQTSGNAGTYRAHPPFNFSSGARRKLGPVVTAV